MSLSEAKSKFFFKDANVRVFGLITELPTVRSLYNSTFRGKAEKNI